MSDKVEIYSETLDDTVIYDKFQGTLITKSDNVFYSRKEMRALINQEKRTGQKISKNQHLAKKIFNGEIIEYSPKPRINRGSIKESKKNGWDRLTAQPDLFGGEDESNI